MCSNPLSVMHVPTVYELMHDKSHRIGTLASQQLEDVYSRSVHLSTSRPATSPSSLTRGITDFLDDILYSSTGVRSWTDFIHIQKEGAALRRQIGSGAIFAHEGVHPSLSPFLKQWADTLRTQRAARARAVGADESTCTSTVFSPSSTCGLMSASKSPVAAEAAFTNAAAVAATAKLKSNTKMSATFMSTGSLDGVDSSCLLVEKELSAENARAHLPHKEDGILPLWEDLVVTERCSPVALHSLREAVGGYYSALLRLIEIMQSLSGHWGLLSPKELKGLHRAMAAEKAAHVPADFIFSAFRVLKAPGERLSSDLEDIRKCTRLEVLRLNDNTGITDISVLPPHAHFVTACGCSLGHFLEATHFPSLSPPSVPQRDVYASLTVLGLAYNCLRHLHFLQQLPSLCVLNVAFNYIGDLESSVHDVAAHGSLTEITLQGNPISFLDVYRPLLVRDCLHLDRLDGVAITGEERALSRPTADGAAAAQDNPLGRSAVVNLQAGASKSSSLAIPPGSRGKRRPSAEGSGTQPSQSNKTSARGRASHKVSALSASGPSGDSDTLVKPVSDIELRTSVSVGLDLIALKGVASLQPVPQSCEVDSLLPSSSFLLELAGADMLTQTSRVSGSSASPLQLGSFAISSMASSGTSTLHVGGGRKDRGQGGAAADGGKGSSSNTLSPNSKRVVVPLYEVSSHITVEGFWGGTSLSSSDAPLGSADSVRVSIELNLDPPAPTTAPHGGRHSAGAGASQSHAPPAGSSRQRKAGGPLSSANVGAVPPSITDPYIPARATAEVSSASAGSASAGSASASASAGGAGSYKCSLSLPVADTLIRSLQQPLLLRVTVHDTFQYTAGDAAVRAHSESDSPGSSRGIPGSRDNVPGRRASGDLSLQPFSSTAISLEEGFLLAMTRGGGGEDTEEEESVVQLRHELGVIAVDPSDLFSTPGPNPAAYALTPCSSTPLPNCRVLYIHNAELEKDPQTLKSAEREMRRRQRRLSEALAVYSYIHQQYLEASRRGLEASETFLSQPSVTLGKDSTASNSTSQQLSKRRASVAVATPLVPVPASSASSSKVMNRSRHASGSGLLSTAPQLQGLYTRLKAQQVRVSQRALRVLAMRARLAELNNVSLSVSARFCVGRGVPPPLTAEDAELDALRRCPDVLVNKKGRQQASKGTRR